MITSVCLLCLKYIISNTSHTHPRTRAHTHARMVGVYVPASQMSMVQHYVALQDEEVSNCPKSVTQHLNVHRGNYKPLLTLGTGPFDALHLNGLALHRGPYVTTPLLIRHVLLACSVGLPVRSRE